jgi:hypothetical protein
MKEAFNTHGYTHLLSKLFQSISASQPHPAHPHYVDKITQLEHGCYIKGMQISKINFKIPAKKANVIPV